jgi:hypothetical protein
MLTANPTHQIAEVEDQKAQGDEKKHAELWFNIYDIAELFRRFLIRINYSKYLLLSFLHSQHVHVPTIHR